MLTYPKSTMRVRRMPMHLSSGHVTLMLRKFNLPALYPPNFPQSNLARWTDPRWALPQISSLIYTLNTIFSPEGKEAQSRRGKLESEIGETRAQNWGKLHPILIPDLGG